MLSKELLDDVSWAAHRISMWGGNVYDVWVVHFKKWWRLRKKFEFMRDESKSERGPTWSWYTETAEAARFKKILADKMNWPQ